MFSRLSLKTVLQVLYAILLVAGAVQAAKISQFTIFGYTIYTPAAVVTYALTFLITDLLSEIYGKDAASEAVKLGLIAMFAALITNAVSILLPKAVWFDDTAFLSVLGLNYRIIVASIIAYIISQTHDVWAFHFWKEKTNGKMLWLRNNASTIVSQLIDTVLFIMIAFYGAVPNILSLIIGQYFVKVIIALLDTVPMYIVTMLYKVITNNKDFKHNKYVINTN